MCVFALFAESTSIHAQSTVGDEYDEALRYYERSDYARAIRQLRTLLYPNVRLNDQPQVLYAHKLLGISYIFEGQKDLAEKEFLTLLAIDPRYNFDPSIDPVSAVELFDQVKRNNAKRLKQILDREKEETEKRRIQELKQQQDAARQSALSSSQRDISIERTVEKRSYWLNFVPFGVGQLQNDHRTKGYWLMGFQAGFSALSIGIFTYLQLTYPARVPSSELQTARALDTLQIVSGGAALGLMAYGIVDALFYYQPTKVTERRLSRRDPLNALHLRPLMTDRAKGVELSGIF